MIPFTIIGTACVDSFAYFFRQGFTRALFLLPHLDLFSFSIHLVLKTSQNELKNSKSYDINAELLIGSDQ